MKFPEYPGGRRVPGHEVRLVLDHSRPNTVRQWAEFFRVHPQSIKAWRGKGMVLGRKSSPTEPQWNALRAEAVRTLREYLHALDGKGSR